MSRYSIFCLSLLLVSAFSGCRDVSDSRNRVGPLPEPSQDEHSVFDVQDLSLIHI